MLTLYVVLPAQHVVKGLALAYAAALALASLWVVRRAFGGLGFLGALIVLAVGGGLGILLYLGTAHAMRVSEISSIVGLVARPVRRYVR